MSLFRRESASIVDVPRTADFSLKGCNLNELPPIAVRYWPHYSNPYQKLFYGFPSQRFSAQPGDAATALTDVAANPEKRVCFHVHWLNFLFKEAGERGDGYVVFDEFLATCRLIREKGGVVAWTVHNLEEHESPDPDFEIEFRQEVARIADIIVVHGERAHAAAIAAFDAAPERIINVVHGSYIGVYDDVVDRDVARIRVGLPERETIFVNVGAIKRYKGLDELTATIRKIQQKGVSVGLLIAGSVSPTDADVIAEMGGGAEAIRIDIGHINDCDMQNYLNAADFVVLPYRQILTSGSAILALSFARPVIAPALGGLGELIDDGVNGFLYDPASPNGLETSLMRAAMTDAATRARMSEAAFIRATGLRWSEARYAFIQALTRRDADGPASF